MSRRTDREREESGMENRIAAAKARYDLQFKIIKAAIDGEGPSLTAERLGISRTTVHKWRIILGLDSGRQWKRDGTRTGRLNSRAALLEVRP